MTIKPREKDFASIAAVADRIGINQFYHNAESLTPYALGNSKLGALEAFDPEQTIYTRRYEYDEACEIQAMAEQAGLACFVCTSDRDDEYAAGFGAEKTTLRLAFVGVNTIKALRLVGVRAQPLLEESASENLRQNEREFGQALARVDRLVFSL